MVMIIKAATDLVLVLAMECQAFQLRYTSLCGAEEHPWVPQEAVTVAPTVSSCLVKVLSHS